MTHKTKTDMAHKVEQHLPAILRSLRTIDRHTRTGKNRNDEIDSAFKEAFSAVLHIQDIVRGL